MTVVAGFDPTEISLSDSAVGKLQFLIAEEDNPSLRFRVYITGGGCSGFQYGFTFDEGLEGAKFVVNNPNATTTCGCGASFSI